MRPEKLIRHGHRLMKAPRPPGRRRDRGLRFDHLEGRSLLTTIVVTGTGDDIAVDGVVTLREAITAANTNAASGDAQAGSAGLDTITFDIPGAGVHTITPATGLPDIIEPVVIDGYTQTDAKANTNPIDQPDNAVLKIQLDGANSVGSGLVLRAGGGGSTIRGLIFSNFTSAGIVVDTGSGGNRISGNFFGTDTTGMTAARNQYGVFTSGANTTVGGTNPADRNVISADYTGIYVGAPGALIQGNFIGTDATGTKGLGKTDDLAGIFVDGDDATIGGTTAGARNVIAGNGQYGIESIGERALIQGNFIGADRTGTTALPNNAGIRFLGSSLPSAFGVTIGGTAAGAGNVIASNSDGIEVGDLLNPPHGFLIQGNFIGTDPTGTADLGNNTGIYAYGGRDVTIGGTAAGAGNVITNSNRPPFGGNNGTGIVSAGTGTGVSILGNAIFGNNGLGITSNQGPNLTSATPTAISFRFGATGTYRLEFFATPDTGGTSNRQGKTFLGSLSMTFDGSSSEHTFTPVGGVPAGQFLTATATAPDGSTSEFSNSVEVEAANPSADLSTTVVPDSPSVAPGGMIAYTITVTNGGPDAAQNVSLTSPLPGGTTFVSFTAPGGWSVTAPDAGASVGNIVATASTLAGGSGNAAVFTFVVQVDPNTTMTSISEQSQVSAETADPASANNQGSATTEVIAESTDPNPGISIDDQPDPVLAGNTITYTIHVTNSGGEPDSGAFLTTVVPVGTTFVSFTAPADWTTTTPAVGGTGSIEADSDTLPSGGPGEGFILVVQVNPSTAPGTILSLTAQIEADQDEVDGEFTASVTATTTVAAAGQPSDPPVAVADTYAATSGTALVIPAHGVLANDSNPGAGSLSAAIVTNPSHGTLTLNADGSFVYTPASGFSGTDFFSYMAVDGALSSEPATVTISVAAAAIPPSDTAPPQLINLQRFGFHDQPTLLVLTFDEALAATSAANVASYRLVAAGRDHQFNTADDVTIALKGATYDPATRTVQLRLKNRLVLRHHYQLSIGGLTDSVGNGSKVFTLRTFDRRILAGPSSPVMSTFKRPPFAKGTHHARHAGHTGV